MWTHEQELFYSQWFEELQQNAKMSSVKSSGSQTILKLFAWQLLYYLLDESRTPLLKNFYLYKYVLQFAYVIVIVLLVCLPVIQLLQHALVSK